MQQVDPSPYVAASNGADDMPRISVITPCFNAEQFIGRTLASVLQQTFDDWEHVIVDDGSTDGSLEIVRQVVRNRATTAAGSRIRLIEQANLGCAAARNTGFSSASPDSRYLLFLDADDVLDRQALGTMVDYLDTHPEVGLAYCDFRQIDSSDNLLPPELKTNSWGGRYVPTRFRAKLVPENQAETPLESVFSITAIIPSVCFLRRSVFEQTPGWDEAIGIIYEDVSLYIHMALRSQVHYFPQPLVRYRRHNTQASGNTAQFAANERRLYESWKNMAGLTAEQAGRIADAAWFREYRLASYHGVRAGIRHVRQGNLPQAVRFLGGAARRYVISLFNRPSVGTRL